MSRITCLLILAGAVAPAGFCGNVVFSDSNVADYSFPANISDNGSMTPSTCSSCGANGAPGLEFAATLNGSSSMPALAATVALNNTFTYSPATQGAIQSISVSVEKDLTVSFTNGTDTFRPTILQDGKYYLATIALPNVAGYTSGFLPISAAGLTAASFAEFDLSTATFGTGTPNFGGDPMTFGLTQASSTSSTATITAVYSNLAFDLTTLPDTPALAASPAILNLDGPSGTNAPVQAGLTVQNSGTGSLSFSAAVENGSPWLTISPSSGTLATGASMTITATVNPQSLNAGSYQDAIQITSAAGSAKVPVSFFATSAGSILWARPGGIVFNTVEGMGSSAAVPLFISNQGGSGSTINWTAGAVTNAGVPNGSFLSFSSASGQVPGGSVQDVPLSLAGSVTNLAAGVYYELVQVNDPNAHNSPQYVTAVLNVAPATASVPPQLSPAGMLFVGAAGQTIAAQQLAVNWSSSLTELIETEVTLPPTQSWLQVTPTSGSVSSSSPLQLSISVNSTGLSTGVYTGSIGLFGPGTVALGSENVTLIVTPVPVTAAYRSGPRPQATLVGCTPSTVVLTETGIPGGFSVAAGWPADLIVTMTDDCGNPLDGGSVTANFSNGDPPLALDDQGSGGQYIGTWQPSKVSNTVITLNGSVGSLKPGTATISGLVTANQAPVLAPDGILNNLNSQVGAPLAPGTVAAAYGNGLSTSSTPVLPGTSPLPKEFDGTELVIGGSIAPLYALSSLQLDVEIPAELEPLQQLPAVAVVNNALSLPVQVSLVPVTPGVAANSDGSVIAQDTNFNLITAANPAHPGEAIVIYLVGMGATSPAVASGQPAPGLNPGDTLAKATVQPVVEVNNQTAQILFAGLTPGAIGLYQIDFEVPSGVTAGSASLTVSQGSASANATTLPVAVP